MFFSASQAASYTVCSCSFYKAGSWAPGPVLAHSFAQALDFLSTQSEDLLRLLALGSRNIHFWDTYMTLPLLSEHSSI